MKKGLKIVTIGGGSSYTPELMEGFVRRYNELPIREIWLVDVEHLNVVLLQLSHILPLEVYLL